MQALYTAIATVTGGRDGRARSSDGRLDVSLAVPKELGGNGAEGATNPEQLFAAGYAACFESAVRHLAREKKKVLNNATVTAEVRIGSRDAGGFGLAVVLRVALDGLAVQDAQDLVEEAHHKICPYSNAVRGNVVVDVWLTVDDISRRI